jgi:beta-glucosidase
MAERFAEYADAVTQSLGDRVPYWITTNEPWSVAFLGHARGLHAPGLMDYRAAGTAAHHLMLAHGLALPAIRANARNSQVGVTLCLQIAEPFSTNPRDLQAARLVEAEANGIFLQPLLKGSYPDEIKPFLPSLDDASVVRPGDLDLIAAPIDFLGLNYYVHEVIRYDRSVPLIHARRLAPVAPLNSYGNALKPESLEEILLKPSRDYGSRVPIYVTEIGNLFNDYVSPEGEVNDPERIAYFDAAFRGVAGAISKGADVRGIFVWTLIDDFEWDSGYSCRYGIVYVDFGTQTRIPKASAAWLRGVAKSNRLLPLPVA